MRIGIFTDTYPPFINGVSTSIQMLENSLRKKGHKVFIVTEWSTDRKILYGMAEYLKKMEILIQI